VYLGSFSILLHHFFLTNVFHRLNYCVQLLLSFLALDDLREGVVVFWSFHRFYLETGALDLVGSLYLHCINRRYGMAVMIFANIFLYLDIKELRGEALKHFETVTALNVHIASALTYQVVRGESLRVRIVVFKFLLKRVLRLVKNCILLALAI